MHSGKMQLILFFYENTYEVAFFSVHICVKYLYKCIKLLLNAELYNLNLIVLSSVFACKEWNEQFSKYFNLCILGVSFSRIT